MAEELEIILRECKSLDELKDCVRLQREVFALPEVEISPVRHFIVTLHAGGFTLGAFYKDKLIGFTLSVPALLKTENAFYSHMTAVDKEFQSYGIGSKLKWKQREISLAMGVRYIKWTFQPVMARNAYFNLEKLGAIVTDYKSNFYGTDYATSPEQTEKIGIDSDRLFAEWHLESEKVKVLAKGGKFVEKRIAARKIETTNDWNELIKNTPQKAIEIQAKLKEEFQKALADGLNAESFERSDENPKFLLFKK